MKRKHGPVIILMLILLFATASATATDNRICNLWLVQANGNSAKQITNFTDPNFTWSWDLSPNGESIVIGSSGKLSFYNLDGQETTSIEIDASRINDVNWHEDNVISCQAYNLTNEERTWFTFSWPDGPLNHLVTLAKGNFGTISPDRRRVIFSRREAEATYPVYLTDLNSSSEQQLPYEWGLSPTWSPTSEYAAFSGLSDLHIIDASGRHIRTVEDPVAMPHTWTSDGRNLLISTFNNGLVLIDPLSGRITKTVPTPSYVMDASISPDNAQIAFIQSDGSSEAPVYSLWLSNYSSAPVCLMANCQGYLFDAKWVPNRDEIIVRWSSPVERPMPELPQQTMGGSPMGSHYETAPDFRNIRWGMTMDQARAAETETDLTLLPEYEVLVGDVTVAGHPAFLYYSFDNNRLYQALYVLLTEHINDNLYVDDFKQMKSLLTQKYGAPSTDRQIWKRDLFKDDPNYLGLAISTGDLSFIAEWETPSMKIRLLLVGDNFEINHYLTYESKWVIPTPSDKFKGL